MEKDRKKGREGRKKKIKWMEGILKKVVLMLTQKDDDGRREYER